MASLGTDAPPLEGIDVRAVTAWVAENVEEARAPFAFELIAGGRSNPTFKVTDAAGRRMALRRPPLGHVLPTAHDMGREFTILRALWPTPVPVPRPLGLCEDATVNGAPFYLMEYVDGHVVRDTDGAEAALGVPARGEVGRSVADALASLHSVDVDAVGLGAFARREGYITRQLERWHRQFDATQVDAMSRLTEIDDIYELLSSRIPVQGPASIVHGDYRLDNTVVDGGGRVLAVLDWELCTLGDPLADLGTLIAFWAEPGDHLGPLESAPTKARGFPSRAEMIALYGERSGRDVSGVDFYVVFGYWRITCALQGVINRYLAGVGSGDRSFTTDELAQRAQATAALASQAAARL